MKLTLELSFPGNNVSGYTPVRIIEGTEEMSALYVYDILIRTEEGSVEVRKQLGKAVDVTLKDDEGKILRKIHGVVMSIESTRQYTSGLAEKSSEGHNYAWYKWTIRPTFAKACYSRNRLVYNAGELGTTFPDIGKKLLSEIVKRWDKQVSILFSEKAKTRIPEFIQLVQNDESDYNFFSRILAAWGLGYFWRTAIEEGKGMTVGVGEILCIFDATCKDEKVKIDEKEVDVFEGGETKMQAVSQQASLWKCNYGMQAIGSSFLKVENYNSSSSSSDDAEVFLSLHDETWDQLKSGTGNDSSDIFMASHDNGCVCHGKYEYRDKNTTGYENIGIGREAKWESTEDVQCGTETYFITKMTVSATDKIWKMVMECRSPKTTSSSGSLGLGVLPRPVLVNDRPDLLDEPLIQGEAWPEPRMRPFMAVVEDEKNYSSADNSSISNRNLCKVREIAGCKVGDVSLNNSMWVEMGSPFADKNSGLLARPRKGNVLFCLDRGDLSIPIALTAVFRGENKTPYAELKKMDRIKRENSSNETDYSAVTLRNRVHVPERTYTKGLDGKIEDGTNTTKSEPWDKDVSSDNCLDVTRPLSVEKLAESPLPFSQIQMISLDNGVKPVDHDKHLTNTYLASGVVETVTGFITDANLAGGYSMSSIAQSVDSLRNIPVTRPHFEGISMYSGKDLMIQSSDHQIINAGGEIVLTAAQGITLRVGKSSVRITEAGVEILSGCGKVGNPGAYPAYHPKDEAEGAHLMNMLGGRIWVDVSGVNTKGPYISNTALNLFCASTMLGSTFKISDFSAKLFAPSTTIVGGAAICDTIVSGVSQALAVGKEIASTCLGASFVYSDALVDGWKKYEYDATTVAGGSMTAVAKDVSSFIGGIAGVSSRFKNLFSITGSMIKMEPSAMTLSSSQLWNYQNHLAEVNTPLSGFVAMGERAGDSSVIQHVMTDVGDLFTVFCNGFSQLKNNDIGYEKSDKDDTFTEKKASKPEQKTGKTKGSKVANVVFSAVGTLGICVTTGLKLAGKLSSAVEKLASILYLGKRDLKWGVEKVQELKKSQTSLQKKVQVMDDKLLSVKRERTEVKNRIQDVVNSHIDIKMEHKALEEQKFLVRTKEVKLNTDETRALRTGSIAIEVASGNIKTANNTQINI